MNLTFATRDMIRALRVLAPALSRGNQDRIYTAQVAAQGSSAVVRSLNDTWEARSAIPATIEAPGEVWLSGDTLRRLPWGTLDDTVRMRRVAREDPRDRCLRHHGYPGLAGRVAAALSAGQPNLRRARP